MKRSKEEMEQEILEEIRKLSEMANGLKFNSELKDSLDSLAGSWSAFKDSFYDLSDLGRNYDAQRYKK